MNDLQPPTPTPSATRQHRCATRPLSLVRTVAANLAIASLATLALQAQAFEQPADGVYTDRIDWGVQMDLSGPISAIQSVWTKGLQAYMRKVNDSGGINGRKINLLIEDTRYDVSLERVAYEKLSTQTPVLGISGFGNSSAQAALAPAIRRGAVPIVGTNTTTKALLEPASNMYYGATCGYKEMAQVGVGYFTTKLNLKSPKVALVHLDVASGVEYAGYIDAEAKLYNGVSKSIPIKVTAADATPQVIEIMNQKPDFIAVHGAPNTAILLLRTLQQYGLKTPVFAITTLGTPGIYAALGPAAGSNYFTVGCLTPGGIDEPGVKDMTAMAEKMGQAALAEDINFAGGWVVGQMVAEQIAKVGTEPTRGKLVASMEKGFEVDTKGVSAPLKYTATDHRGPLLMRPYSYDFEAKRFKAYGAYTDYQKFVK